MIQAHYLRLSTALRFDETEINWYELPSVSAWTYSGKYTCLNTKRQVIIAIDIVDVTTCFVHVRHGDFEWDDCVYHDREEIEDILCECLNSILNFIDPHVIKISQITETSVMDECFTDPLF